MQDLKQKVIESLKTKGYHEYQLKELNPIIQATIEATQLALSMPVVGQSLVCEKGYKKETCERWKNHINGCQFCKIPKAN